MTEPRRRAADTALELLNDLQPFRIAVNRYAYKGLNAQTFDPTGSHPTAAADRTLNQIDQLAHDQARTANTAFQHHIRNAYTVLRRHTPTPTSAATIQTRLRWLHTELAGTRPVPRRALDRIARDLNTARVTQLGQIRVARQVHAEPCNVPGCGEPLGDGRNGKCGSCRKFHERFARYPTRVELERRARGQNMRIRG